VPALNIWGADDAFQPLRYGLELANSMPRAHFVKIDHAGHFLPEDEPTLVAGLIGDFVKST
jgi:pimeloyl-ACP methyl ester carboxylesterase